MQQSDFLREIIASPKDDGPRLIYADWLDSVGQPERAMFIRHQIELCHGPNAHCIRCGQKAGEFPNNKHCKGEWALKPSHNYQLTPHALKLRAESQGVLDKFATQWIGPFANGRAEAWTDYGACVLRVEGGANRSSDVYLRFERGFVRSWTSDLNQFLWSASMVARTNPVTRYNLIGRFPYSTAGGKYGWDNERNELGPMRLLSSSLPDSIWGLLPGPRRSYDSALAAQEALSEACVLHIWAKIAVDQPQMTRIDNGLYV